MKRAAQRRENILQRRQGRRGLVALQLGNEALGKLAAIRQLFLSQAALQAQSLDLLSESPIIPLCVRDEEKTFIVTKLAFDEGIFINPVIPPACAPDDTLVRVALMATHTREQVDFAVEKLTKCFKQLGILE